MGVAAATANTAMQIGGSIGTAVLNTVAITATAAYAVAHGRPSGRDALVHGYATATGWSAGALAVAAAVVLLVVRTPRPTKED